MTLIEVVLLLVVAGVCGSIGQAIGGYSRGGFVISIVLGFIGAMIGRWLAGALALPEILMVEIGGEPFPIIWSIIGAALFMGVIGVLSRPGRAN